MKEISVVPSLGCLLLSLFTNAPQKYKCAYEFGKEESGYKQVAIPLRSASDVSSVIYSHFKFESFTCRFGDTVVAILGAIK